MFISLHKNEQIYIYIYYAFMHMQYTCMYAYIIIHVHVCQVTSVCSSLWIPMDYSSTRLLCPWDSPGKNTEVSCHTLLQGVFPTQGSNPHLLQLLHSRKILYHWATRESHLLYIYVLYRYAFELWCWRRLLGVLWTARRSNMSILKEISPKY